MARDRSRPDCARNMPLFSLERFDRYRTKLDSLHCAPRLGGSVQDLDSIKTRVLKRREETLFGECTRDTATPKFRIVLHLLGHVFVAYNVRNNGASTFFENTENFVKEFPF